MELDEHDAIRKYQEAKSYLPLVETVAGLAPADFDQSVYPEFLNDRLAALHIYNKELELYSCRLIRAAALRQKHYREFIKKNKNGRVEELGHRAWRKEMNKLAIECQDMLVHWKQQYEKAFDAAIVFSDRNPIVKVDLSVKNIEYNNKEKPSINVVPKPRLADAERKRRKKELKKRKQEAEVMLKKSIKEFKSDYAKIEEFHDVENTTMTVADAIAVGGKYIRCNLLDIKPRPYKTFFDHIRIQGSQKDKIVLFD